MNVLLIGSGGREHALAWGIIKSPLCSKLYCAPGNPGIASIAECLAIPSESISDILAVCHLKAIDFVVVGPEVPLALGLVDHLKLEGIACFGPSQKAAEIESSKGYMKDMCARAGIPTAEYCRFTDAALAKQYVRSKGAPIVIKADGLAAGKGVTVARTLDEALTAIEDALVRKSFGSSGSSLVVEEFMEGEEVSFFALSDGAVAVPFTTAQDHKTVYDGDKGPNTGGMGAYSPAPIIDAPMQERIMREIINPTVKIMCDEGRPFVGVLYAGLMMTKTGPRLIEYNARFGDPETQVMIPRLKSDLLSLLYAASKGMLEALTIDWHDKTALCVVMAAEGYPGTPKKGTVIRNLDKAATVANTIIFHAGTALNPQNEIVASGGRVLGITATAPTIRDAQKTAYQAVSMIDWPEGFCRRDIGWRAINREKAA